MPMLRRLSDVEVAPVKQYLSARLEHCDASAMRTAYYTVMPIARILCDDLMREVLSFCHPCAHRAVCVKWCQLSTRNANARVRGQLALVDSDDMPPRHQNALILHPHRTRLYQVEESAGFIGICNTIKSAVDQSADVVLVYDEHYPVDGSSVDFNRDIGIIGVGQPRLRIWRIESHCGVAVYMKNIQMRILTPIAFSNHSSLYAVGCTFRFGPCGAHIWNGGSLKLQRCRFIELSGYLERVEDVQRLKEYSSAFRIRCTASQLVMNECHFENCNGHGCVRIVSEDRNGEVRAPCEVRLKCRDNSFDACTLHPFVAAAEFEHSALQSRCDLRNNVWNANSGPDIDANVVRYLPRE